MHLETILPTIGYFGITLIVFAESGLFFGFFLPGDSLLFTAGFLASQNYFNVHILFILTATAAISGDSVGYWFGKKIGPKLFVKEDSRFFHKKNLAKAQHFYEKHGKFTIIISRFIPIIRTFAPIVAGIGEMKYSTFISYNIFGGFLWTFGMIYGGYFLGKIIPDVDKYLLPIVCVIVILSVLPTIKHLFQKDELETP
ncbi:MAG: hypothetical protein US54_C0034G0008 [Candidatus Roizmanbacteria bacterium GW2011_GWA2_37_7]|uniref:VTT domain-containing protein n=1 Tax=Candidatus Roizmanbacteria bacterium GW2011_GWA2_37_7 TaxID=1618481 RepID=A0A0G0KA65_9BACT|nr:MAG: hypothetical protein US54_C0034G0008 [Candidatus Roizmanbacteria bacterium GW2011_GWA2_37_7]